MGRMIYAVVSLAGNPAMLPALLGKMTGIDGAMLDAVVADGLALVVCDVDPGMVAGRQNLLDYASVIETLAGHYPLLPVRFGSVMASGEALVNLLERNRQGFEKNLEAVRGRCEFGLKVFCDPEKLRSQLEGAAPSAMPAAISATSGPPPSLFREYVNRKLKDHRREEQLLGYVNALVTEMAVNMEKLHVTCKFKLMATEANIIDACFLAGRKQEKEMVRMVETLRENYPGLKLILTGPWPPYNFVDITLK